MSVRQATTLHYEGRIVEGITTTLPDTEVFVAHTGRENERRHKIVMDRPSTNTKTAQSLKVKPGVGMTDDKTQDNAAMKGVAHFSHYFSPFP